MPTYDYECDACGHTFDTFQNMSDAPLKKCPSCGKVKLRRLIGGGLGVIFKGSGFYATDSKSGGPKAAKKSEAAASSDSSSSSSEGGTGDGGSTEKKSTTSDTPAKKESTSSNKTG